MNIQSYKRQRLALLAILISISLAACGSPQTATTRMLTVGILNYVPVLEPVIAGFKAGLTDLGYVEGKNVTYLYDGIMKPDNETLDTEIQSLLKRNTDIFLALGTPTSERIKKAIEGTTKSAVFAPVINPGALGLVTDLHRPGGRMTGIDTGGPILEKGLEWLLTVSPAVKRIHVPYRTGDDNATTQMPTLQAAATKLKVELVPEEVSTVDQAISDFSTYTKGTDAAFIVPTLISDPPTWAKYMQAAIKNGIPVGSSFIIPADANPVASITTDFGKIGKQAARLVHQIFQGADPGTIPVESADFAYTVNLATANGLGLTVPDSILQQANTVVPDKGPATPSN